MEGHLTVKTLYIHAGFPKTGSSFLQTVFSRNAAHMASHHGIAYVEPDEAVQALAAQGRISSGNGSWFLGQRAKSVSVADALAPYLDVAEDASLISNENFALLDEDTLADMHRAATDAGFRVHAAAFIRDPFELSISAYLQNVKRGTIDLPFDRWVPRFRYRHDKCAALFGTVFEYASFADYGDSKQDLVNHFFKLIGREDVTLPDVPVTVVNRSISLEECDFLLKLNAQHRDARFARQVSDFIVENFEFSGTELSHSLHSFRTVCNILQRDAKREEKARYFKALPQDRDPEAQLLAAERIQQALCRFALGIEAERQALRAALPAGAEIKSIDTNDLNAKDQFVAVEQLEAAQSRNRILRARNHCLDAMMKPLHKRKKQKILQACQELEQEEEFETVLKFLVRRRYYEAALWVDGYASENGYPSLISDQEREGLMAESLSATKRLPLLQRLISR